MFNTHAARIGISAGLVMAVLATGSIAEEPSFAGTWAGVIDDKSRKVNSKLIIEAEGSSEVGNLRLSAPHDCNIELERVAPNNGEYLFNVTQTTATGFCRRYDGGQAYLALTTTQSGEALAIRLETAPVDPRHSLKGTLQRSQ